MVMEIPPHEWHITWHKPFMIYEGRGRGGVVGRDKSLQLILIFDIFT